MSTDPLTRLAAILSTAPTVIDVAGHGERPLAAPQSHEQWSVALRIAREERWKVLVTGFGSKLGWRAPSERVDLVLTTRACTGVSAYEPGDGTLTARAGTSMAELTETVATGGHHLSPDVARPAAASLGGVISAGVSGVERLAYGPVRHNLLGTVVCLADGNTTKSGGRLVKNVTGYDLHRLYCGAHGSLCVVLEASLRLYPLPAAFAALSRVCATRAEALAIARGVQDMPLHPRSITVDRSAGDWRLTVVLGGREDVVTWELQQLEQAYPGSEIVHGEAAHALQRAVRDLEPDAHEPALWLAGLPSRMGPNLARVEGACAGAELRVLIHPAVATATIVFAQAPDTDTLAGIDAALAGERLQQRWRNLPRPDARPVPPGLALMKRLGHALDPAGVFADEL